MAITFWRNVQRKITTQEMDASFDTLVNDIANAGISSEMPEGTIYIGDNTNTASLETLNTSIVPETTDKNYVTDAESVVIANTSGTNTGDNATNTTSNAYADAKVADVINDGTTTIAPSQNAVFDALALKEDLITKNATNTPLVWTSANGVASFQPLPILGDLTYYLTNTASDVATYYKQTTTPQVALTSLPFASVTNGQLLATFISEPSNPNRLSIPDGQYLNHLHLGKTGGTKDLQVRAEIWETTSVGVDVVKLADLGPSTDIVGSGSAEYIIGYNTVEKTLSAVTSRIATKIYAVVGASGSAPSISIFQGDGSDSRSNLPAPVVDASNYVPYTGALNDVDLGSKKITTTDIIVSGATASTIAHFDATKNIESLPTATYPNLTELSYVKGATSAIQTQINAKVSGSGTTEFIPKFTASGTIGNSAIRQNYYDHATFIKGSASYAYALSVYDNNESVGLLMVQNNGAATLLNSIKHQFGSNGVGQIIFDRNLTNNNLSFFRATDTSSANYIQGWINSTEAIYGLRYSNDLVAYWQSVNTTASTKISRWANSANTQVALLQNDGLYLGTGTKSASAVLQADSTTQGFLPPRMTSAQKEAITDVEGLVVFDTDIDSLCQNNGTTWTSIGGGSTFTPKFFEPFGMIDKFISTWSEADQAYYQLFKCPYDMTITKLFTFTLNVGADTVRMNICDSSGTELQEGSFTPASQGYESCTITSTNLTGGSNYWIGIKAEAGSWNGAYITTGLSNGLTAVSSFQSGTLPNKTGTSTPNRIYMAVGQ